MRRGAGAPPSRDRPHLPPEFEAAFRRGRRRGVGIAAMVFAALFLLLIGGTMFVLSRATAVR